MSEYSTAVYDYYRKHLQNCTLNKTTLPADCPFCKEKGWDGSNRFIVIINKEGFFHGYFRCLSRCVPGGFVLWFTTLLKSDPTKAPGFDPDREPLVYDAELPAQTLNKEIKNYQDSLTDQIIARFQEALVTKPILEEMGIGYNGRYIVYPYFQEDGNCYSARCIFPDRAEDYFWYGEQTPLPDHFQLFNVQDITRCDNGALVVCEGEDNLLALKQLGLPGVALPDSALFETIDPDRFAHIKTIFISTINSMESEVRARSFASRLGFKARLLNWKAGLKRNYSLWQLAKDSGRSFRTEVTGMARNSKAFSPFATPKREHDKFFDQLERQQGAAFQNLRSGFNILDDAIGGIHGINVIGGAPKVGKSCFMIQIGTQMALRKIPVLYYDFENGRQKIYQRTMSRLSRIPGETIVTQEFEGGAQQYEQACSDFKKMLHWFRVINDRKLTPEIMRRHIDFIRHETQSGYTVVVIDSLHKLPFKDFSERRSGIDGWLRQLESIRDELDVSFLVISELTRGDRGTYKETPHMGVFKGSGDIEYSADNALVLFPEWDQHDSGTTERTNNLWLVASREHSPGLVASYHLDYPYWGFTEREAS